MSRIPEFAKACVLTGPGKFEVREVVVPVPGEGEVLCKIKAVAICGSDPEVVRGDLAGEWPPSYPSALFCGLLAIDFLFVASHDGSKLLVGERPCLEQFGTSSVP